MAPCHGDVRWRSWRFEFNLVTTSSYVSTSAQRFKSRIHWCDRSLFLAGSVPLAIGLSFAGVLTTDTVLHSLMGLNCCLNRFLGGRMASQLCTSGLIPSNCAVGIFNHVGGRLIAIGLFQIALFFYCDLSSVRRRQLQLHLQWRTCAYPEEYMKHYTIFTSINPNAQLLDGHWP